MRTVAANSNSSDPTVKTLGDIVAARHFPILFENDLVKVILPILQESDLPAAGVIDWDGKLIGLLTERALLRQIFARSRDKTIHPHNVGKYIDDLQVGDVMIDEPEVLDEKLTVEEAAGIMLRRGYRFMPVVDHRNKTRLVGIVSERELAAQLQEHLRQARASEKSYKQLLSQMLSEPYGAGCCSLEA
jgi:CBS domain-containing protein